MEKAKGKKIPIFKTTCQEERDARDIALLEEYNELTSVEGQSKTKVTEYLMEKYNIHSAGTVYVIRQRAAELLKQQQEA